MSMLDFAPIVNIGKKENDFSKGFHMDNSDYYMSSLASTLGEILFKEQTQQQNSQNDEEKLKLFNDMIKYLKIDDADKLNEVENYVRSNRG